MKNKKIFACTFLFFLATIIFSQNAVPTFYWEKSSSISARESYYPKSANVKNGAIVFWQEVDKTTNQIYLTCCYMHQNGEWTTNRRFAGPFDYYGEEIPELFSVTSSSNGKIAVAVQASESLLSVFSSSNGGESFLRKDIPVKQGEFFAPRIYSLRNGKFILFVSCAKVSNPTLRLHDFYIYQALSDDALSWSQFSETFSGGTMVNSFAPFLCSSESSDVIVFQSRYKNSYQIFTAHSENGGKSWSETKMLTDSSSVQKNVSFEDYDNQGPFLLFANGIFHLAWERRLLGRESSEIWYEQFNIQEVIPNSFEIISDDGNSKKANLFYFENNLYATWFDSRSGQDSVFCSVKDKKSSKLGWKNIPLENSSFSKNFPVALAAKNHLYFLWQEKRENYTSIKLLSPDTTVAKATVIPDRYVLGTAVNKKNISYRIRFPEDASGIEGFIYSWSTQKEKEVQPENSNFIFSNKNTLSLTATEEGTWYLKIKLKDKAGNWSGSTVSEYVLDLTAPKKVSFNPLETDSAGFMKKNSFAVSWLPNETDEDIAGFVHSRLTKVASIPSLYNVIPSVKNKFTDSSLLEVGETLKERYSKELSKNHNLNSSVFANPLFVSSVNLSNGLYVFSVAAVDKAGNIGEEESIFILLNKYIPKVRITELNRSVSPFGDVTIDIFGTDFNYGSKVNSVFIDKDGKAPYDLNISSDSFSVSQTKIGGVNLGRNLEEGSYYVGIKHSLFGTVISSKPILHIDVNGTVKIENEYEYIPSWRRVSYGKKKVILVSYIVLFASLFLSVLGIIVFGISLIKNCTELFSLRKIINQLEQGTLMMQNEKDSKEIEKRRKGSLKTSLAGFTISLVVLIITVISLILGVTMIRENESNLSKGLKSRVNVLLTSISTGARTYLQTEETFELNQLLNQAASVEETEFVTISGMRNSSESSTFSENASGNRSENESANAAEKSGNAASTEKSEKNLEETQNSLLYVWASNDKEIASKVNVLNSRGTFLPGISVLEKEVPAELVINETCRTLNNEIKAICDPISKKITALNLERQTANASRCAEIDSQTQENSIRLQDYLLGVGDSAIGSVPEFNDRKLNRSVSEYLFYRPVLFRSGSSSEYVRGIVFVKVDTTSLIKDVADSTRKVLLNVLFISVGAVFFGILFANLFANRIVRPIKMLEKTVTEISEENDKERLLAGDIKDLPNNEIGRLGDSVNRMKKDLGYNARELNLQANDATPIQQSMIALEPLSGNFKQNISNISDSAINEFAYYKGASGASGDYFDFKKLDDRWYVLIKCDASGHAAPAGILVTMVATLYKKYFEQWKYSKNGTNLDDFVYKVNDFLESLNIKGKFVAFIICLFDSKTGDLFMSHAGDRLVRIYDSNTQELKKLELVETPAAGPFPSFMMQMKGGFKTEKTHLTKNDILLLYTDGIEENGRVIRTPDFAAVRKAKRDKDGNHIMDEYGNLQYEDEKEEFGEERIKEITQAVLSQKKYVLKKQSNPSPEVLEFDFTNCSGTTKDLIMALSSAEKLFRLYKPNFLTVKDLVEVDRSIDAFLKEHFNLYSSYATSPTEQSFGGQKIRNPKNPNNVFYASLREDPQDDDLTIIALKRV